VRWRDESRKVVGFIQATKALANKSTGVLTIVESLPGYHFWENRKSILMLLEIRAIEAFNPLVAMYHDNLRVSSVVDTPSI
jgi:hypothetical protein